ncbi:hypothetical protein TNCV_2628521 [Trichonephila clavipes]|uniref:Uncharacterized protein n=1 Tax=Trichonephila clavipes TaxID=2585209 RepID=A0A8X6SNK3_TRICX|nr:hypothetical protein TNCV_2628521 [Trichonephila clavipes]
MKQKPAFRSVADSSLPQRGGDKRMHERSYLPFALSGLSVGRIPALAPLDYPPTHDTDRVISALPQSWTRRKGFAGMRILHRQAIFPPFNEGV